VHIERDALQKAIGLVVPGIAGKEVFDQADKLAFEGGKLISYNDEVSIFHPLVGSEELDGAVDGKRLFNLLNRVASPSVTLTTEGNELIVTAGRVTVNLSMAPVVLPYSEVDWSGDYIDLPEGFKKALTLTAGTCAKDMSRPVLTCVHIAGQIMIAADGYRVAQFQFEDASLPDILLPVTAAEVVLDDDYGIKSMAVGDGGEWVRFMTNEETVVCARLSTGTYPDLSSHLDIDGVELVLPRRLLESLERAKIFAKRDHRIDESVNIDLRGKQIVVRADYDGGRFQEVVKAEQEATGSFSVHPDLLIAALSEEDAASCILGRSKIKFLGPNWEHVVALR
jgi:DNA polymerase III sliding clamp (beta) subunit (PCNA family)